MYKKQSLQGGNRGGNEVVGIEEGPVTPVALARLLGLPGCWLLDESMETLLAGPVDTMGKPPALLWQSTPDNSSAIPGR